MKIIKGRATGSKIQLKLNPWRISTIFFELITFSVADYPKLASQDLVKLRLLMMCFFEAII
jgi:hypothetical protein